MKSLFSRKRVSSRRWSRRLANAESESFQSDVPRFGRRRGGQPLVLGRVISLGVLTALGWAVVNSLGVPSSPPQSPISAVPIIPISGDATSLVADTTSGKNSSSGSDVSAGDVAFQLPPLSVAKANDTTRVSGTQISINGHTVPGQWQQKDGRIGISITSMANVIGVELLGTTVPTQQPIRWFQVAQDSIMHLPA